MDRNQFVSIKQLKNHYKGEKALKKSIFTKVMASAMAFGIAATAFSAHSFANTTTSTISGGELTGGGVTFSPLTATLNGSKITSSADWALGNVIDARGTGAGWHVSLTLSQFKEFAAAENKYVPEGKTLATNSLKVSTVPTVAKVDDTSSEPTTITPVALNTALDTGSAVKLLSSSHDGGMGSFKFSNLGVNLTIPASAYAKTYKSEATVTLNTAP